MFRILIFLFSFFSIHFLTGQQVAETPLLHAHSHNDYLHDKPLWGALQYGCTSLEIDVFAHKNQLKVAHIKFALNIRENFTDMYLHPLIELIEDRGYIYNGTPLILMIDFKSNGDSTLPILLETIKPYQEYFSFYHQDSVYHRDIQLVISGRGFSYDQVKDQDSIYVFMDGSAKHCENDFPSKLVPRGSTNYNSVFKWKGKGEIPENELEKLRQLVDAADSCDKELRFYAMPPNERIWHLFLNENVYWINVDNIFRFRMYLENQATYEEE